MCGVERRDERVYVQVEGGRVCRESYLKARWEESLPRIGRSISFQGLY